MKATTPGTAQAVCEVNSKKKRSGGRVFGWECGSVSVRCHVWITGAWQLRNSDVQFGVTFKSETLSCCCSILWQYAISTRCYAWKDMTLWMSVLMHFKKGLSVLWPLTENVSSHLILLYSQWNVIFTLICNTEWFKKICCNLGVLLRQWLSSVCLYINTTLSASIHNDLAFIHKTGTQV